MINKETIEAAVESEKPKQIEVMPDGKIVRKSWIPAALLGVPKQFMRADRKYRWGTDSVSGNIRKKEMEQWQVDHEIAPKMAKAGYLPVTSEDAKIDGTVLRVRDQILMWMPMEIAEARAEYYSNKSNLHKLIKDENDKMKENIGALGAKSYGKITIE